MESSMEQWASEDKIEVGHLFEKYQALLERARPIRIRGEIKKAEGLLLVCRGPASRLGEICEIISPDGEKALAEVIGFDGRDVKMMPLSPAPGIVPGHAVYGSGRPLEINVGEELIGRVIDAMGRPLDGDSLPFFGKQLSVFNRPPHPLKRKRISTPLEVGIKVVDGLLTLGKGQRMGIFSGTGVGKSTILSMIARNTEADVNVIALVGERGREVREFIDRDLGPEGMKRSVVVVATADTPALARIRSVFAATTVAEFFREQGKDVMLMVDSLTRLAMAQREVSLSLGELPTSKGYTPSVFAMLPGLIERTGCSEKGSITALYNVLVEGDNVEDDPLADAVRGMVDGHIVLSRDMALRNQYPAIDVPRSLSRLMPYIVNEKHQLAAAKIREWIANYDSVKDLLSIGAYVKGESPSMDEAVARIDDVYTFLKQGIFDQVDKQETGARVIQLGLGVASPVRKSFFNQEGGGGDSALSLASLSEDRDRRPSQ